MNFRNSKNILSKLLLVIFVASMLLINITSVNAVGNSSTFFEENVSEQQILTTEAIASAAPSTAISVSNDDPTPLRNPLMNGIYFPKQSYAKICFEVDLIAYSLFSNALGYFGFDLDRVADTYSRYFRVYIDETRILNEIVGSSGYHDTISYSVSPGKHFVTVEIYYGGNVDYGWKLTDFDIIQYYNSGGMLITFEGGPEAVYFPQVSSSRLIFDIVAGTSTKMNLLVEDEEDSVARYFSAYIDGTTVVSESWSYVLPWSSAKTFNLGSYTQESSHKLALQVRYGAAAENGWKLMLQPNSGGLLVHYLAVSYEIDYMDGHEPHTSVIDYIEDYYIKHGFARIEFTIDDEVTHDDALSLTEYNSYYNSYFDHSGVSRWKYVLFGHKGEGDYASSLGWAYVSGTKVFIADNACDSYANSYLWVTHAEVEQVVLMHECGHSIGIIDYDSNGDEDYCSVGGCVMNKVNAFTNCGSYPWYCYHHWGQRNFP